MSVPEGPEPKEPAWSYFITSVLVVLDADIGNACSEELLFIKSFIAREALSPALATLVTVPNCANNFVVEFAVFFPAPDAVNENSTPPKDIEVFDPWDIPLINTLVLLLSGTTVTWAHHALLEDDRKGFIQGLSWTVFLGVCFTALQAYEYQHATFEFSNHIYGATFYMATGFHGFHVIIGTIFLAVCLWRGKLGHFNKDHHFGFEAAAWYWHFVDVVWLFLFAAIYVWGS